VSGLTARRTWWLRSALAVAMAMTLVWVADHGVAGVALSAVLRTVAAVDAIHLSLLGLIWAGGLAMYSVVLSSALPGLGAKRTLAVNLAGSAVANTVPLGGALASALNWRMLHGWGQSNAAFVAYSTVTNVLAVITKLALPVVAVGLLVLASEHVPVALWCAAVACALTLALAAGGAVWLARRTARTSEPKLRWKRRLVAFCAGSGDQILQIVRRRWAWLVTGSLAYTAAQVVLLGVSFRAVGLVLPMTSLVAAAAIERLGTVVPFTPGGAGVAEAGTLAWLIAIGVDPTQAVAGVVL
jgi:putative heme transporter